jgi:hypothetical protein
VFHSDVWQPESRIQQLHQQRDGTGTLRQARLQNLHHGGVHPKSQPQPQWGRFASACAASLTTVDVLDSCSHTRAGMAPSAVIAAWLWAARSRSSHAASFCMTGLMLGCSSCTMPSNFTDCGSARWVHAICRPST